MISARHDGNFSVRIVTAFTDDRKRVRKVLLRGGRSVFEQDPFLGDAVRHKPVVHGLRLCDGLTGAHPSRDDHAAIGVSFQVFQRAFHTTDQREGGPIAVDRRAQDNQVRSFIVRVGAGAFDNRYLHNAEINETDAGQNKQDAPEKARKDMVRENQKSDERDGVAPIDVTAQGKTQKDRQRDQGGAQELPVLFQRDEQGQKRKRGRDKRPFTGAGEPEIQAQAEQQKQHGGYDPDLVVHVLSSSHFS